MFSSCLFFFFFFSSRRRHTRCGRDWSSDVCSSDLRRAFGVVAEPGQEFWWDSFLESAVRDGTLPVLAAELFGALDQLYALVAVPYVRKVRQRELREALAQAVRLPGGYAWGPELQQSFRRRLGDRDGM